MKPHSSRYLSDLSTKVICNPTWAITLLSIDWYTTWLGHLILLTLSLPFTLMLALNIDIFGHIALEICGLFSNIFWYWFLTKFHNDKRTDYMTSVSLDHEIFAPFLYVPGYVPVSPGL